MKIGKTRLEVSGTPFAQLDVMGIVNPANNMLWMGGGISSEIRKSGGESIEQEALGKAPSEIGEVVVTGAGSLKAQWIIHAVISGQDLITSEEKIRKVIYASMVKANEIGCISLAIPVLTTGIHDVEVHIDVHAIIDETVNYLVNEKHSFEHVIFMERDEKTREIFTQALLEKFTKHG